MTEQEIKAAISDLSDFIKADIGDGNLHMESVETAIACMEKQVTYGTIGTPEQFTDLMKAKAEGRIAECTCGECRKADGPYESCGDIAVYCNEDERAYSVKHFCSQAERRDKDD